MAEQIKLRKRYKCTIDIQAELTNAGIDLVTAISMLNNIPDADVEEVVRCKDCKYHHWEQEPCHGKTVHICSVLNAEVFKDFYCYHGKRKEQSNG